jgi:acetolactate synthase-1/2/3 large subunit
MKSKSAARVLVDILRSYGCNTFFAVSGGAALHLMHAVRECPGARLIVVNHEQTVAMAVDAYCRLTGNIAVGIVTSGPGATNLTTGLAGAYFDSIPCVFVTGQVATFRQSHGLGVRQYGFQETRIPEIFKPITKSLIQINSLDNFISDLHVVITDAINGRPGPVVIDFPDDLQRQVMRNVDSQHYKSTPVVSDGTENARQLKLRMLAIVESMKNSQRPIIVCGAGVANSGETIRRELLEVLDLISIPVCLTWGAKDLVPGDRKYLLGTFGTHGNRSANIAIQKSDFLLVLGSRLDTKSTGTPPSTFAPAARKILLDIDENEVRKFSRFGVEIHDFIEVDFRARIARELVKCLSELKSHDWSDWVDESSKKIDETHFNELSANFVEPYEFIRNLSENVPNKTRLLVDTGCSIAWTMQEWKISKKHRIFHDFNNTSMGWSIPASLASELVEDDYATICIVGDGSLMMTLSDLVTLRKFAKKTLVILMNNFGHSMIRQTQDQWFSSKYVGSDSNVDLSFPDFELLAQSNGFNYICFDGNYVNLSKKKILEYLDQVTLLEVKIDPRARVIPQNKFGQPIHVMEPEIKHRGI